MAFQPGVGYTFTASSQGETINVIQPWTPLASIGDASDTGHPFKIVNVRIATYGGSQVVRFQVQSGTINNLVPLIDDYVTATTVKLDASPAPTAELVSSNYDATTKTSYIYLRSGPKSASPYNFPDDDVTSNRYPVVIGGNVPNQADDNVHGFVLIGTITVDNVTTPTTFTVNQYVTGSLWADRIKLGSITAKYYYARI